MAAHSDDAQKRIIEKAIIKSTIGRGSFSRLPLFDNDAEQVILFITKQISIQNEKKEYIIRPDFIKKIAEETGQSPQKVEKILRELLNPKRIEYIFELTAEIRLEKISAEEKSEIEHLQSSFNFLMDFILFYPYSDRVQKNKINIGKIHRQIAQAFTQIYFDLIRFQEKIEQKIALKEAELEQEEMPEKKREGLSTEDLEKIREERLEKKQKEQEERLAKEKKWLDQLSIQEFSKLFPEFEKWFSTTLSKSLSEKNADFSEKTALKRQLIAVQVILNRLAEKVAEKEAVLKALEKEEALKISEKKEDKVLSREENLEKIKITLMEACNMSAQDAESQALTIFENAEKERAEEERAINASRDSFSVASPPPPPPLPLKERVAAGVRAFVRGQGGSREVREENLEKIKRALMETCDMPAQDAASQALTILEKAEKERAEDERAVNASRDSSSAASPPPPLPLTEYIAAGVREFVRGQGGSDEAIAKADALIRKEENLMDSIMRRSSQLITRSEVIKLPKATKIPAFTKADKLEESILHVLSALPGDKELGSLDTGYILIGHETAQADLYHVHEGTLVKCDPKDLTPLCGHVSTFLGKGENKHLQLSREEHRKFIVSQGGGHDYSKAKAEAESKAKAASILAESLLQSSVPQKKLPLHEFTKELLKDGQDWPEDAAMANNTFYYKWDKVSKILTGKCRKEDGDIFTYSQTYKAPLTITALSEAFAQSKLTLSVIPSLVQFSKNAQGLHDKPPAKKEEGKVENVEPVGKREGAEKEGKGEKEEGNEEEKRETVEPAGGSPREGARLFTGSSSNPSFYTLPKPLVNNPQPTAEGSNAGPQPPAEESSTDSKPNSGMGSPR